MLETGRKKYALKLGGRIAFIFIIVLGILFLVAYHILSQNFHKLLSDCTINLMEAMVNSGVSTVETELLTGKEEAEILASSFTIPTDGKEIDFPMETAKSDVLRMVYVSDYNSITSDNRKRDIHERPDIKNAYHGNTSIYGPYYNEENEYVICYSAPVYKNKSICGVLSIEKNGYRFCDLIEGLQFAKSGESYIINEEGTDIAVSNSNHIDWVKTQYNAQKILKEKEDSITRSVMELEQKGLNGQKGIGTYTWDDSLCYLAYAPIPSVGWVLLTGIREAEIANLTQSTLYSSFANRSIFTIFIIVFFLLTSIIIFWIISSMKKNDEINKKLSIIANYDSLTGAQNRNSFHTAIDTLSHTKYHSLACIYIDVNGLHEVNNHLGHQAGDKMLKTVVDVLQHVFSMSQVFRIGGDEFVLFCENQDKKSIYDKADIAKVSLHEQGYEISVGIKWENKRQNVQNIVNSAEEAMQQDKQQFYLNNGHTRQLRSLNQKLEKMVLEKQDADTFLSVLAPEFKGVYFVNLGTDAIRHLYIPLYFQDILNETGNIFSKSLTLYIQRYVIPKYQDSFIKFSNYENLEKQFINKPTLEFDYQKNDGTWLKLKILKFKTYTKENRETLWIFSNIDS